ncbi:hypothetical protein N8920_04655 [Opitutales bacterium]|nr:hypothetical protein [Opitutales bacterium]
MDLITVIVIVSGLLFAGVAYFIEDAFDKMLNPIFRLIGLKSSTGPLDIIADYNDQFIELTIINNGKGKAMLAAVQVVGENGKKEFPVPFTSEIEAKKEVAEKKEKELRKHFLSEKIDQGSQKTVYLNSVKSAGCDLKSLSVLDMDGKHWTSVKE